MNKLISCGNCKGQHATIQQVRICCDINEPEGTEDELLPCEAKAIATGKVSTPAPAKLATVKQVEFILTLQAERNCLADRKDVEVLTLGNASALIGALLAMPKPEATVAAKADANFPGLRDGYYAIDMDDTVKFYRVDMPTEGKWAGRTFLSVQASDDFHAIKNSDTRNKVLAAIVAQGVEVSMRRYGLLIGRCGVCRRTLTDETSRAYGIGPVCRDRF